MSTFWSSVFNSSLCLLPSLCISLLQIFQPCLPSCLEKVHKWIKYNLLHWLSLRVVNRLTARNKHRFCYSPVAQLWWRRISERFMSGSYEYDLSSGGCLSGLKTSSLASFKAKYMWYNATLAVLPWFANCWMLCLLMWSEKQMFMCSRLLVFLPL